MRGLRIWRSSIVLMAASACILPAWARVHYQAPTGNRPALILIKGELVQADVEAFTAIAETARQAAANRSSRAPAHGKGLVNVALDSRGGSIWVAMSIGRVIRKHAFMTRVETGASCVSACVYLLAAGQGRYVGGRVGIHRPYLPNDGVTSARAKKAQYEGINAQTRQYLEEMGLPGSLHDRMMQTAPDRVTWLSAQDLSDYGLTMLIPATPRAVGP
ncbi:Clp protease [Variovorax sp. OV329]|nr:Clp protease [Variovorax sp. OV329]